MKKRFLLASTLICAVGVILIYMHPRVNQESGKPRTYAEIIKSGEIRATTEYNSIGYFVKDDSVAGFHYELLQAFAHEKGLQTKFIPEMKLEKQLQGINNGNFDLIAGSLLITTEQKDSILQFTIPILRNRQLLIQRKKRDKNDSIYIENLLNLGKKTVYLPEGSPARYRIQNLAMEIADTIYIKEIKKYGSEQIMALVAHQDIDYVICEESIAKNLIDQFPQLDINTAISFNQFYGWGANKNSNELIDTLNSWLNRFMKTKAFNELIKKYNTDNL